MKTRFILGLLAVAAVVIAVIATPEIRQSLNFVWGDWGGEALVGTAALVLGIPTAYYFLLPSRVAVVFYNEDGKFLEGHGGLWSDRIDYTLFAQSETGKLFGGFVTPNLAELPMVAEPAFYHIDLFGNNRGIYKVITIFVTEAGWEKLASEGFNPKTKEPTPPRLAKPIFSDKPTLAFQEKTEAPKIR